MVLKNGFSDAGWCWSADTDPVMDKSPTELTKTNKTDGARDMTLGELDKIMLL